MLAASRSVRSKSSIAIPSFASSVLLIDPWRVSRDFLTFTIERGNSQIKIFCAPRIMRTITSDIDLIILNMHTDSVGDLELAGQLSLLKSYSCDVPFVVILDAEHDQLGASLLWRFDMHGYILNSSNAATLAAAIRLICAGGPYRPMPPPTSSREFALSTVEAKAGLPARPSSALTPALTPAPIVAHEFASRETDVLRLLQQAKPNKIIAHELDISVNTAKVHVRNIVRKLRATNRTQVVIGTPPQSWSSVP